MREEHLPARAIERCRDQTRAHSKTFYFGSRFFPRAQRQAVWAVYAACREGDDIADESPAWDRAAHLDAWWARVRRALNGEGSGDHVSDALAWAARTYPIPESAFEELYEGLRMDLAGHAYDTAEDLELYCRRVAGVVGFMIAPISGFDGGDATLQHALRLGQAMQLTNILRDVGEDWARERVYLPQTLLEQYGVTRTMLARGTVTPEYRALMRHLCAQARTWYAQGRAGIPRLHGGGRLAVAAAARAYEGILDALERNDYDNFNARAHVSGTRKLLLLPQVWWECRA
ncbi:phytoene/squalene synthase family protein [Deinococcus maricopensis]|uniref:Phytoene synthase n=1 Tax=Deinococcus maricopensis (strain DSM 21211 / LMG 22137 / NRRL B-23946 / LB-34) TaxID=709986 RepID=E8UAM8_DEIML|nr:phytoene/squalene synthase family protein [Deinococcus maricopensis]ADV68117.1 Phytoene synthase [Deinococcus maricopensis DSM 21211]